MTDAILTVDIGTSSCKGVVVTPSGDVVARAAGGYAIRAPEPGAAEQDPEEVLQATKRAIRGAIRGAGAEWRPRALVFSSAMHTLVAVDEAGWPLTPLYTWADARGMAEAAALRANGEATALQTRTGTPVHASSPFCKLLWLRSARPDVFERASAILSIKEYVLRRLVECDIVDASVASATGLFDLATGDWCDELLGRVGLERRQVARVAPTQTVLESWKPSAAEKLGLDQPLPIVIGATDGVLANVGVGASKPGEVALTMGTSGAARAVVDRPDRAGDGGLFCYVLDDASWVVGGAVNNCGLVVRWLGELFFDRFPRRSERVMREAESSPIGAQGLAFLPRLSGERFPHYDSDLLGAIGGLSLGHRRKHVFRAALEGSVWAVAKIVTALESAVGPFEFIRAGGGMMRAEFMRQMVADMTGVSIGIPESTEASAVGGACLARSALGLGDGLAEARNIGIESVAHPDPARADAYAELRARLDALAKRERG